VKQKIHIELLLMGVPRISFAALGLLLLPARSSELASCAHGGSALSEEDVERCEAALLQAQEVSLLQRSTQNVDLAGDEGDGYGDGDDSSSLRSREVSNSSAVLLEEANASVAEPVEAAEADTVDFLQESQNRTSLALESMDLAGQLVYELEVGAGPAPRSKVALVLLEMSLLGSLGIDRCYMGQCGLGILKAMTGGGLAVWAMFDYLAVVITCLSGSEYMNAFGMKGHFLPDEMTFAFWLTVTLLLGKCFGVCYQSVKEFSKPVGSFVKQGAS